jgi:hypothetical protein
VPESQRVHGFTARDPATDPKTIADHIVDAVEATRAASELLVHAQTGIDQGKEVAHPLVEATSQLGSAIRSSPAAETLAEGGDREVAERALRSAIYLDEVDRPGIRGSGRQTPLPSRKEVRVVDEDFFPG